MPTGNLKLTSLDKKILHSYCQTLDGLSNYLGNGYEIVLHSLEDYEHSAIKVINGYHTGRTEGAPITDLALKMLEQIRRNEENDHGVIYFSTNVKGEPLKSTTIPVKGEKDRIIGLLCINFYMNTTMADFFCNLLFRFHLILTVSQSPVRFMRHFPRAVLIFLSRPFKPFVKKC